MLKVKYFVDLHDVGYSQVIPRNLDRIDRYRVVTI
jgi:hypothetical protein